MNKNSLISALLVLGLWLSPLTVFSAESDGVAKIPVVILFDRSFSMTDLLNGQPKIEIAKAAFRELAYRFHGQSIVSVRFFAGGRNKQDDHANCVASEQILPLGEVIDVKAMEQLVADIRPLGRKTNIAFALEQASKDLAAYERGKILLISDGAENCEGDPIGLAESLATKGIEIDTIGIGSPGQFSQLGRIALVGSGEFQLADSAGALATAMGGAMPAAMSEPPGFPTQGAPVGATAASPDSGSSMTPPQSSGQASSNTVPAVPAGPVPPLTLEFDVVSAQPTEPVAIEVILDVSGSMAAKVQGERKMDLARSALHKAVRGLDSPAFVVGFRAYGFDNTVPKTPEDSCPNTELLNAIEANQVASIRERVATLHPYGYTPIARSLELAGADLLATDSSKQMIILISDGEETCGGDPVRVAEQLREMGIDVETHVIGFDLDKEQAAQMRAVAKAGGGQYYDAKDAAALEDALLSVIEVAQNKVDPTWLRAVHPVEGGSSAQTAVDLTPGTYTLTRYLDKGEQMYFRVNTKKAQYGVVRGLIQSRRLIRQGDDMVESELGYSQYRISLLEMRGKKNRGRYVRLSGEPGSYGHVGYSDTSGDGFIFTISSNYDRVHKDALFNIGISEAGDKYQGAEASDDLQGELIPLTIGESVTGHLGDGDNVDIFSVVMPTATTTRVTSRKVTLAKDGPALTINFKPEDKQFKYRLTVKTATGKRLGSGAARGESVQLSIENPGGRLMEVFIEIKSNNPGLESRFTAYKLVVH